MAKNKKYRNRMIEGTEKTLPDGSTEASYIREEVLEAAPKEAAAPKFDFDAWFASRQPKIPRHHRKEILRADFTARGLGQCESLADFDAALNKYGVKLS
jgi:hypothetical protein